MIFNPNGVPDINTSELDVAGFAPMNQESGKSAVAEKVADIAVDPELLASTLASVAEAIDPSPGLHVEAQIAVLKAELGVAPAKNETGWHEAGSNSTTEGDVMIKKSENEKVDEEELRNIRKSPGSEPETTQALKQLEMKRDLQAELLGGAISGDEFLEAVFARDQEDSARSSAAKNLALLEDPAVVEIIKSQPELQDVYGNYCSISAFHIAQQKLTEGDTAGAFSYLEKAITAAKGVTWENYDGWKNYIKATEAYANENMEEFMKIYKTFPADDSYREVLDRLMNGLNKNNGADYARDYGRDN